MSIYKITVDRFEFPEGLGDGHANFRMAIGIRYVDSEDNWQTFYAVLPGPSTYWECDKEKKLDPRYVRVSEEEAKLDMDQVGPWGRYVARITAQEIEQIKCEVYDVNRKGAWETFKSVLTKIPNALASALSGK